MDCAPAAQITALAFGVVQALIALPHDLPLTFILPLDLKAPLGSYLQKSRRGQMRSEGSWALRALSALLSSRRQAGVNAELFSLGALTLPPPHAAAFLAMAEVAAKTTLFRFWINKLCPNLMSQFNVPIKSNT